MRHGRRAGVVMTAARANAGGGRRSRRDPDAGGVAGDGERVRIALTAAQVDEVVRTATDSGNMTLLMSGLGDMRARFGEATGQLENPRLSGSLLCGLMILASFPADGSYMSVKEISKLTGKSPSTAHRYISTLVAVGLLERDPSTRAYRLVRGQAAGSSADAG
jgi:IclR-like helix-turn-helix domain-containing protein